MFYFSTQLLVAQQLTNNDLTGIYFGDLKEGYSQHTQKLALRFYPDGIVMGVFIPGEPADMVYFEKTFSRESQSRFDQGRYQVIGTNVEFTLILAGKRLYFKGPASIKENKATVNYKVTDLQTKAELNCMSIRVWPSSKPVAVKEPVKQVETTQEGSQTKTEPPKTNEKPSKVEAKADDKSSNQQKVADMQVAQESSEKDRELEVRARNKQDSLALTEYQKKFKQAISSNELPKAIAALNNMGTTYFRIGSFEDALSSFGEALKLESEEGDSKGMATLHNNMGASCERLHQRQAAIRHYQTAAELYQQTGLREDAAKMMHHIATVEKNHLNLQGERTALEKLIEEEKVIGNDKELSASYNNLAVNLYKSKEFVKAIEVLDEGIRIDQKLEYLQGLAIAFNNKGNVEFEMGKLTDALADYRQALAYKHEIGDQKSQAITLHNMGNVFVESGKVDSARYYFETSLEMAEKAKDIQTMHANYKALSGLMAAKDGCSEPLEYYKLYTSLRFAVNENKELRQLMEEREKYFDKQFSATRDLSDDLARLEQEHESGLLAINLLQEDLRRQQHAAELEISTREQDIVLLSKENQLLETEKELAEQNDQLKTLMLAGAGLVSLLSLGLLFVAFKSNVRHKKDKKAISEQKHIIEEKNKDFVESVTYARRLQDAILPPLAYFQKYLPEHFLFYKPKDIVAGDFYWLEHVDHYTYLAVADCTGHGVPGAMVSVVCANALERALKEFNLRETNEILDKVRELVIDTFRKSESEVKDGMDVALCRIDNRNFKLQFTGANNSLIMIRKRTGKEQINEKTPHNGTWYLNETKADKQPVGQYSGMKPFNSNLLQLEKGDTIYLFSDGFADQFGGEKGKKLKVANLKQMLFDANSKPMNQQQTMLDKAFENWKGEYEQVDDVCIIGVRF